MNVRLLGMSSFTAASLRVGTVLLTCLLLEASAAPTGAGYRETVIAPVPAGETSNLVDRLFISEGTYNKTEAGTLALAASNLVQQTEGRLVVREGALRIQGDTRTLAAPAPCPYEILASAAFWVDATTNLVTVSSNDNTYVDAWLDVREPDTGAPFLYPRAVANWTYTNISPQCILNAGTDGTMPSVWFGRYGSLRTMTWTTPENTVANFTKIYHVFAVHGVFQSYGYVFGSMSDGMPDFHITDFTTGSPTAMIWHPNEWSTTAVRQGRTYLDGVRIDGTALPPKRGWQLLEVAMAGKLSQAANFFNDRGIMSSGKRAGGDNLCEVAVFTNRLSETERMLVQSYLMQKWLGTKAQIPPIVHASASGTVIADAAENNTLALRLNGDGTIQKQGAGVTVLEATPASSSIFRSAVVQSGTLDARLPVPLSLTAGDRVTTSNTAISVTQDAGAGQLAKDGPGTVTLSSVPDGVTQVNVNGGTVVLATPANSVSVTAVITGSVPNATFESEQLTSDNRRIADGETYHGWTAYVPPPYPGADNAVFIFNRQRAAEASKWPCDYDAPEGQQVLALKQDASVSTSLSLPVAGVYDVSFYTSARSFRTGKHEIDLCLVEGATTNAVTTVQTVNQAYARQSFRLPWLEAGTHTLLFRRNVAAVDTLGTIDDIKVTLVSTVNPNTVRIPNGDFELTDYPRDPTTFTTSNVARGWTFTAVTNGEISAGITMPASSVYAYTPSTPYGVVMLCLISNGCARSASFALPAGTYALQGVVCKWPCRIGNKNLQAAQSIKATVARATGDSIELGSLEASGSILTTRRWPTAFTVTDNETITLTLAGTGTSGVGLIDNLELIPQTSSIIQNGGFESAAGWSFFADKVSQPKAAAWYNELSSSNHYGTAIYDGVRRLLLVQTGAAFQDIQIPAPGLYRLVFHAAQRCPLTYGNVYGHNPVRAWLARDGATNVIGWTRVDDNAIVRREFLFNVAVAGTYRFGLQGMSDNSPQYPGTDQNALIDGVSIEPASDLAPADIPLPKNLSINVAEGAYLQLSFASTQKVERVKLGGHFAVGVISQETYPDAIIGPGALYTTPKGSLMMLR